MVSTCFSLQVAIIAILTDIRRNSQVIVDPQLIDDEFSSVDPQPDADCRESRAYDYHHECFPPLCAVVEQSWIAKVGDASNIGHGDGLTTELSRIQES
jgi:hypothetical protein